MNVTAASDLYMKPETLLQSCVIIEELHLSFVHMFQINVDKVQYASLQVQNLQNCEFNLHIHGDGKKPKIEQTVYTFPEVF